MAANVDVKKKKIGLRCSKACWQCDGQSCIYVESTCEENDEHFDLNNTILSATLDEVENMDIEDERI